MIDISDGIAKECHTLAFENRLGIMLEPPDPAIFNSLQGIGSKLHCDPLKWYLYGGEDYELLFAASPRFDPAPFRKKGVFLTKIGEFVSPAKGVHFKLNHDTIIKVEKLGWDHLKKDLV